MNSLHANDTTQAHPKSGDGTLAVVAFCIVSLNCNGVWSHRQRKDATNVVYVFLAHENKSFVTCSH